MNRRIFVIFLCLTFLHEERSFSQTITANEIIDKIKHEVNCPWNERTVDNIKGGLDGNTPITGIATTFMATLDVIKKAKAQGCNLVITHEPTFYSHTDDMSLHVNDPIQIDKLKYLQDHHMVVWRFHDHIHQNNPDMIYAGVLKYLNWAKYQSGSIVKIPSKKLKDIVAEIDTKMKTKTMRILGNPDAVISNISLVLGAAGSDAHFKALQNPDVQLLIVGESNEWETVPYIQDAISEGKNKALIVMGHTDSEEAGMDVCADWLKKFYPSMKIQFIRAGNPFWGSK